MFFYHNNREFKNDSRFYATKTVHYKDDIYKFIKQVEGIADGEMGYASIIDIKDEKIVAMALEAIAKNKNIELFAANYNQLSHESVKQLSHIKYLTLFCTVDEAIETNIAAMSNVEVLHIDLTLCKKHFPKDILKLDKLQDLNYNGGVTSCVFGAFPRLNSCRFWYNPKRKSKSVNHDLTGIEQWKGLKNLILGLPEIIVLPTTLHQLEQLEHFSSNLFKLQSNLPPLLKNAEVEYPDSLQNLVNNIDFLQKDIDIQIRISSNDFMTHHEKISALKQIKRLEISSSVETKYEEILPIMINIATKSCVFSELKDDNTFFENIEHFKHIEELEFRCSAPVNGLEKLAILKNLKSLKVHLTDQIIPAAWNQLQKLEKISLKSFESIDIAELGHLPQLKEVVIESKINNVEGFLEKNPQITSLQYIVYVEPQGKPLLVINNLLSLEHLTISTILFEEYADEIHFSKLQKLKSIVLSNNRAHLAKPIEKSQLNNLAALVIDELMRIPALEEVFMRLNAELPIKVADWNSIKSFGGCESALELVTFPKNVTLKSHYAQNSNAKSFDQIRNLDISPTQKAILWGLQNNRLFDIEKYLATDWDLKVDSSTILLVGKPQGITKIELEKSLKAKNFNVASRFTNKVTHVFLGEFIAYETALEIVKSDKKLLPSSKAVAFLNNPEDFYLLQEENEELNEQVIRLLLSNEEANLLLALELIEAGGVTNRVLTFLLIISQLHDNVDIRKKTRTLFKRFASPELKAWTKSRYNAVASNQETVLYYRMFSTPLLSMADAILCFQYYRNKNIIKRRANGWMYERGIPYTFLIDNESIHFLNDIGNEIELVEVKGFQCSFSSEINFKPILDIIEKYPKLTEIIHLDYSTIEKKNYDLLKQKFKNVTELGVTIV